jgi:hypothetical protein
VNKAKGAIVAGIASLSAAVFGIHSGSKWSDYGAEARLCKNQANSYRIIEEEVQFALYDLRKYPDDPAGIKSRIGIVQTRTNDQEISQKLSAIEAVLPSKAPYDRQGVEKSLESVLNDVRTVRGVHEQCLKDAQLQEEKYARFLRFAFLAAGLFVFLGIYNLFKD